MVYKLRHERELEIPIIYKEIEKDFIIKLKKEFEIGRNCNERNKDKNTKL